MPWPATATSPVSVRRPPRHALRATLALAMVLAFGGARAQDARTVIPVVWEAPETLRLLYEKYLPAPTLEAKDDRGALRRWIRDARRRAPEIAAAEGWFSAEIEVQEEPARLLAKVAPGERAKVTSVAIEFQGDLAGEGEFRANRRRTLRESWRLAPGSVFRQADWDEAKARLLEALSGDDYATGVIAASEARVDAAKASAAISIVLDSGPAFSLGGVEITGLSRYPAFLVDRLVDIDVGEPYRSERLLDLQRTLQSAPWFSNVLVEIERDPASPLRVPVRISLLERPVADVGLSLGYGTDSGARGEVSLRYRNAFGRGYDMHSALQADKTRQISYADFFLPPNSFGASFLGTVATKDSVGVLGEHTFNRGLDTRRVAVAAYRQFIYDKLEVRAGLSYQAEQAKPDGGERTLKRALAPNATVIWRLVDDVLDPRRGGVLTLGLAAGWRSVLSDQDFVKTYAQYQHWFPLSPVDQLIVRAEAGVTVSPSRTGVPEDFLYRAGGTRSVRGYGFQSLGARDGDAVVGGRYLATGTVEYVRWIKPAWGAAVFMDIGDATDERKQLQGNKGFGVGARWRTPAGPLALDVAYADRDHKVRMSFSVSVAF